jgi:hypothetical protein
MPPPRASARQRQAEESDDQKAVSLSCEAFQCPSISKDTWGLHLHLLAHNCRDLRRLATISVVVEASLRTVFRGELEVAGLARTACSVESFGHHEAARKQSDHVRARDWTLLQTFDGSIWEHQHHDGPHGYHVAERRVGPTRALRATASSARGPCSVRLWILKQFQNSLDLLQDFPASRA